MTLPPVHAGGRKGKNMSANQIEMGLVDTHNIMCRQLKRLENVGRDELAAECDRARIMTAVMSTIIDNSKTILEAQKLIGEYTTAADVHVPGFLSGEQTQGIDGETYGQ